MNDTKGTNPFSSLRWGWIAILAAAALAILETQRLVTLIGWERTLPFARDLLPAAMAAAAMTLFASLVIIVLALVPRTRKWGLGLGIGWGAIVFGSSLWVVIGPYVKNLWQELLFRVHLTNSLLLYEVFGGPDRRMAAWISTLGGLLAIGSLKGFLDSPRDRLDSGIVAFAIFYAALYDLAAAVVARLVTPH
jgi:hypothetical protein